MQNNKNIFYEQQLLAMKILDVFNPEVRKRFMLSKGKRIFPPPENIYNKEIVVEKDPLNKKKFNGKYYEGKYYDGKYDKFKKNYCYANEVEYEEEYGYKKEIKDIREKEITKESKDVNTEEFKYKEKELDASKEMSDTSVKKIKSMNKSIDLTKDLSNKKKGDSKIESKKDSKMQSEDQSKDFKSQYEDQFNQPSNLNPIYSNNSNQSLLSTYHSSSISYQQYPNFTHSHSHQNPHPYLTDSNTNPQINSNLNTNPNITDFKKHSQIYKQPNHNYLNYEVELSKLFKIRATSRFDFACGSPSTCNEKRQSKDEEEIPEEINEILLKRARKFLFYKNFNDTDNDLLLFEKEISSLNSSWLTFIKKGEKA